MVVRTDPIAFRAMGETAPVVVVPAARGHAAEIADLHRTCIDQGFLSTLGHRVLRNLYAGMIEHPGTNVFVAMQCDEVVGFVAVTERTGRMYKWLLRHRFASLALPLLRKMFSFSRIRRIAETLLYPASRDVEELPAAELLSMAVAPTHRRLGIGRRLVGVGLRSLAARGCDEAKIACADILTSNGFYQRLGFSVRQIIQHHELATNMYCVALRPAVRPSIVQAPADATHVAIHARAAVAA
jgi:ribosomal protein S18 acetylase RimI-like enzyme